MPNKELRSKIIRLAKEKPELRKHLLPLLKKQANLKLSAKDKKVLKDFVSGKEGSSKKLTAKKQGNDLVLEGNWMGGSNMAIRKGGEFNFTIAMRPTSSNSESTIKRFLKKETPSSLWKGETWKSASKTASSGQSLLKELQDLSGDRDLASGQHHEYQRILSELSDLGMNTIRSKFAEMGIRDRGTQQKIMIYALDNAKALRLTADFNSLKKFSRSRLTAGTPVMHPETGEKIKLSRKMRIAIFYQLVGKTFIR